mgnify:CR=1 FL=1
MFVNTFRDSIESAGVSPSRLDSAARLTTQALLAERLREGQRAGTWEGELSTSALSTATATLALWLYATCEEAAGDRDQHRLEELVAGGRDWLLFHQNEDGGWGDTVKSLSNISTTMLAHATLSAVAVPKLTHLAQKRDDVLEKAQKYIEDAGGVDAVMARYGRDRTFSIPILTHCALAELVDWKQVLPLPFELAALPHRFYKTVRLPVVSYALPALIAIGLVRFERRRPRNPLAWLVRRLVKRRVLKVLAGIQPSNGGFLEAAPLTSFVTMSLAGCGLGGHDVARRGVGFLVGSVREDGSWPIDTNLATWVTTLSANALSDVLEPGDRQPINDWLLGQQFREIHPYTNADPGGWSWTDLPGGVPDADDTPGAILALLHGGESLSEESAEAISGAVTWLLSLQNRDGGWPTFCRGWGTLPFDKSSPDITAHVLRALLGCRQAVPEMASRVARPIDGPIERGFAFLRQSQRSDGAWVPLWFGNQHVPNDENPVYGTARVLSAWRMSGRGNDVSAVRARQWLASRQNSDGGWGGDADTPSSVEETALATEALLGWEPVVDAGGQLEPGLENEKKRAAEGVRWLVDRVESGTWTKSSPIGFYFAKLWYFEKLYPLIFTVSALQRACLVAGGAVSPLR